MGEFSTMRWPQSALFLGLQISQIVLGENDSSKPLPNIVIMLADDLGWHDLSWHNPRVISPHLAVLANDGIVLEQHYSQQVCSPTREAFIPLPSLPGGPWSASSSAKVRRAVRRRARQPPSNLPWDGHCHGRRCWGGRRCSQRDRHVRENDDCVHV